MGSQQPDARVRRRAAARGDGLPPAPRRSGLGPGGRRGRGGRGPAPRRPACARACLGGDRLVRPAAGAGGGGPQAVEASQGPDAAEAVIAQVGANVGGRMEEAYRAAHAITDRLGPEQIAELSVRLKGAMGGAFYVVEADAEKIVLGNRKCPFGPV